MEKKRLPLRTLVALAAVVIGAVLPMVAGGSSFMLVLASHALIAGIVALSLDLLTGNVGLLTFGHAAWYGLGAYVGGLLAQHVVAEMLVILPLTAAISSALAAVVGLVLVRQVGKTFAILTLAMSQIMFSAVFVFSNITGGEDGLQGVPVPTLFGMSVNSQVAWYWLLYVILVVSIVAAIFLRHSPLGRSLLAIKENTERARFIGLNVSRLKLIAYVLSAALAAVAGGLHVLFNGAAAPDLLHWFESGKILMYAVLGGVGTIVGPVIGAVVFTLIEHYVSSFTQSWMIFFGAIFVFIVIVAPGGLHGLFTRAVEQSNATKGR